MVQAAEVFALCTLGTFAAAMPLSLIGIAGSDDAPLGAVLRPVAVVAAAYVLLDAAAVPEVDVTRAGTEGGFDSVENA